LFAQQTVEVKGVITDEHNEPLIGVNIVVKDNPGLGTVTDIDGRYKIKTTPYSILIFTYIGFEKQEIPVTNNTELNVIMNESKGNVLDEVVITGVGAQKKVAVTGAITSVDMKTLRTSSGNITNSLAGNVAGIIAMQTSGEPGANASEFWIRGISTFGAGSSALVLVDGFERPFNELNIEDIESFSVLKDASATAIYGSKGANGVILITTKRGASGKVSINAKAEYGYSTRTRTPEFADANTYASMVNEALITRNQEPLYSDVELDIFKYGLDSDLYPNIDWQDVMLRNAANNYRATVNLSGGGSMARYYVSGSYFEEEGMYKADQGLKGYKTNSNLTRTNWRANVDMDITSTSLVKLGVSGFMEKRNRPGLSDDIWISLIGQNPTSTPIMYSNGLVPAHGTGNQTNPWVLATQTGYQEHWQTKSELNLAWEQNLKFVTDGLRFVGRIAFDNDNKNDINRRKWPEQYNVERRRDGEGNLVLKRISTERLASQLSDSWGERIFNMEAELSYDKRFLEDHHVTGLVKYQQRELANTNSLGGEVVYDADSEEQKIIDFYQQLKDGIVRRTQSLSGRFSYDFKSRYFVDFNFGYTGSETFEVGSQYGFFPAISGAWIISEEPFIKNNLEWLNLFKLRYSYGEVGNDQIKRGDYAIRFPYLNTIGYIDGYNYADYGFPNSYTGKHFREVAANNLTWETAVKHNFGLDISLFNNKFSGAFDVFQDTRSNIYMERSYMPTMVGITSRPWANVGKMQAKGFDGHFNLHDNIGAFDVNIRGNITYSKNEVLEYDEEYNGLTYKMTQGFRWDQARGLISEGLFKDYEDIRNSPRQTFGEYMPGDIKYKDVNGDGLINDDDVVPIGATRVPNLVYGLGASVSWKGIDFNVHFQGSGKSSYFLSGVSVYPFVAGDWGNILTDAADPNNRWISSAISGDPATENVNAKYPRLSYNGYQFDLNNDDNKEKYAGYNNYRASTFWLKDGAYLRFKTLEIGYTLPKQLTQKIQTESIRLFFVGTNLFVWDTLKLWDPELASEDGMKYPPSKTLTMGLTVNF
ncbi:MAG: TonB-dependent receptor, partial [Candidatus Symbiothrix sp.]|nr:TonB-dependent receptor [Candidatus Symbiothrix sp.]